MKIEHTAFLDLENALAKKTGDLWKAQWANIAPQLNKAIQAQHWAAANILVDSINTRSIVIQSLRYALTIGMSSLLLGASRLGKVNTSVIVKHPPLRQLKNGLAQWGHQVYKNFPKFIHQRLHEQLADLEQAAHEQPHVYTDGQIKKDAETDPDSTGVLDSVGVNGEDFMSLTASLMVSRLSSFGFLSQAQHQGITQYAISACLDDVTCGVCEELDGTVFSVDAGISQATSIMDATDADSLKSISPWPSQSAASVSDLSNSSAQDLVDSGLSLPPYHPNCRCITVAVEGSEESTDDDSDSADQVEDQAQSDIDDDEEQEDLSLVDILSILGIGMTPDEIREQEATETPPPLVDDDEDSEEEDDDEGTDSDAGDEDIAGDEDDEDVDGGEDVETEDDADADDNDNNTIVPAKKKTNKKNTKDLNTLDDPVTDE